MESWVKYKALLNLSIWLHLTWVRQLYKSKFYSVPHLIHKPPFKLKSEKNLNTFSCIENEVDYSYIFVYLQYRIIYAKYPIIVYIKLVCRAGQYGWNH